MSLKNLHSCPALVLLPHTAAWKSGLPRISAHHTPPRAIMAAPSTSALPAVSRHPVEISTTAPPPTTTKPSVLIASGPHASQLAVRPTLNKVDLASQVSRPRNPMAMASVVSPQTQDVVAPKASMTSKEWVIPPRPKPGRKPATDTPPTKRKAQNRAAQRAFRERRAARVGELEEQLDEQKEDAERTEVGLRERIRVLELELQNLRGKCAALEYFIQKGREIGSEQGPTLAGLPDRRWKDGGKPVSPGTAGLPEMMPGHRLSFQADQASSSQLSEADSAAPTSEHRNNPLPQPLAISQILSPSEPQSMTGCGRCTLLKCECLEEAVKELPELKRPLSRTSPLPEKRQRRDSYHENEIDFTEVFAKKPAVERMRHLSFSTARSPLELEQVITIPPKDGCGFCKDGTYCVCADSSLASTPAASLSYHHPGSFSQQTQTPPPSEHDVMHSVMEITSTGAVKLPRIQTTRHDQDLASGPFRGCGPNGPGSCKQCLSDPKSGLFCRSLAANYNRQTAGSGRCCGGGSAEGGCCKTSGSSTLSLPCADAYKTLASHPHFTEAADEIGSWLPALKIVPARDSAADANSGNAARHPIEVEAASIMTVLKGFDVRFGA